MTWIDNQEAVDCVCCYVPKNETIQYVFVEGKVAEYIWKANGSFSWNKSSAHTYKGLTELLPVTNVFKLNIDGSYYKNTEKDGIGGVVRNEYGDFIVAFTIPVQCSSSNQAEAMAIRFGVKWCKQNGYMNVHVELDSMIIANMLNNKDTNNLKLKHRVRSTTKLLNGTNHCISHCYREVNKVDFMAKLATTSSNKTFYQSLQ
ncbi:uncharacterized protein LOC132053868 [Lycium ferocissimum]|uniref:uncharacterized protein LOC132053868 n=1 Tax=Lycium ferocissimum TaxID=112874 RepID=UPI0028157484|nr:uncharacterized protein LOC132053868 [Lycium ferocissimum]